MPRKPKAVTSVEDRDRGFRRLAADLGGVSEVTLGVFGSKASAPHTGSRGLTVGQVAAMHELGLGGMKRRSFVRAWMDRSAEQMRREAGIMLQAVVRGGSRKALTEALGAMWVRGIHDFMLAGRVRPENAPATIEWKGHELPAIGKTLEVAEAVSYKVRLPQLRSLKGTTAYAAQKALEGIRRMRFNERSED